MGWRGGWGRGTRLLDCASGDAPRRTPGWNRPKPLLLAAELPRAGHLGRCTAVVGHALPQALQAWLQARQQGVLALELAWHHDLRKGGWQAHPGAARCAPPSPRKLLAHLRRLLAEHLAAARWSRPPTRLPRVLLQTVPMPQASASLLPRQAWVGRSAEDHARSQLAPAA